MATNQETIYRSALDRSQQRYADMMTEMQGAKTAAADTSGVDTLEQTADIYKTGGEYGAGARTTAENLAKKNLASAQAGSIASGMSSGSGAANIQARYSRDLSEQYQNIEDVRYSKLDTALTAVAAAKEARATRIGGAYQTTAQLIAGYKEPTLAESADAEALLKLQGDINMQLQEAAQAGDLVKQRELLQVQEDIAEMQERAATNRTTISAEMNKYIAELNDRGETRRANNLLKSNQYIAKLQTDTQKYGYELGYMGTMSGIQSAAALQESAQAFEAGESAKYKVTAADQLGLAQEQLAVENKKAIVGTYI